VHPDLVEPQPVELVEQCPFLLDRQELRAVDQPVR